MSSNLAGNAFRPVPGKKGTTVIKTDREQTEDRQEEILQALIATVTDEGINGTTIKTVAERAGVSTALVFYYFKSKEDLLGQAWASALSHFRERTTQLGSKPGLEGFDDLFRVCFVDRDEESPPWSFWLDFWSQAVHAPALAEYHSKSFARLRETNAERLRHANGTGQLKDGIDPLLAADAILAILYGLAVESTLDSTSVSNQRAYEVAKLILGLLAKED